MDPINESETVIKTFPNSWAHDVNFITVTLQVLSHFHQVNNENVKATTSQEANWKQFLTGNNKHSNSKFLIISVNDEENIEILFEHSGLVD